MSSNNYTNGPTQGVQFVKSRPGFMTPSPVSPKSKRNDAVIHPELCPSVLGKRKYDDAFGEDTVEYERYGQNISNGFFAENIGHGVPFGYELEEGEIYEEPGPTNTPVSDEQIPTSVEVNGTHYNVEELLQWCNDYLAGKISFNI